MSWGTSFIPACFCYWLKNRQLCGCWVKVGSWSYTSCQLAVSSLSIIALSFIYILLLAREVSNRTQSY